jgi:hypothetical protein
MAHAQSTRDMQEATIRDQVLLRLQKAMEGFAEVEPTEGLRELPTRLR